jgi:hypothetical protein
MGSISDTASQAGKVGLPVVLSLYRSVRCREGYKVNQINVYPTTTGISPAFLTILSYLQLVLHAQ